MSDFSRVARAYRWMEYASFAKLLERTRFLRLPEMRAARHALVLGDGDGRFLAQLVRVNPRVHVDAVDFSPGMVRLARKRLSKIAGAVERVRWIEQDALEWEPQGSYDLVVSHFFVDCFTTKQVRELVSRIVRHMEPGSVWTNSDFTIPAEGWMRIPGWLIVRGLYAAFYVLAGLKTQKLPEDVVAFASSGLQLLDRQMHVFGLLKSESWTASGHGSADRYFAQ